MTTIHDRLAQILQGNQGQALSAKDIKERLLARYPHLNPLSVIPADHVAGVHQGKYCKLCKSQPLLEKLGHGVYRVLEGISPHVAPSRSLHEKLAQSLADQEGQMLTPVDIKARVLKRFPDTHEASILPAEHVSGGPCRECAEAPLLERVGARGLYRIRLGRPAELEETVLAQLPREKLAQLFGTHSPRELLVNVEKLEGLLIQQCGMEYMREIRLLISAWRERIPFELQEYTTLVPRETLLARLVERLYKNWCIAREFGRWAVESWSQALAGAEWGNIQVPRPAPALPEPPAEYLAEVQILWDSRNRALWANALNNYWTYVKEHNLPRELQMNQLHQKIGQSRDIMKMGGWYNFLVNIYFPWFFTQPIPLHDNTVAFRQRYEQHQDEVAKVMDEVFALSRAGVHSKQDILAMLEKVQELDRLGPRSASGLLALLFPNQFGTASKHVLAALLQLESLPEQKKLQKIQDWTTGDAALVIQILRKKAKDLNKLFATREWTPRRIDLILFALRTLGPDALKSVPAVNTSLNFMPGTVVLQDVVN